MTFSGGGWYDVFLGSSGTENSWQSKGFTKENLLPVGACCCLTSLSSSLLLSKATVWRGWEWAPAEGYILPWLQANWRRGQDTPIKTRSYKTFFSFFFFPFFFFSLFSLEYTAFEYYFASFFCCDMNANQTFKKHWFWKTVFVVVQFVSLLF